MPLWIPEYRPEEWMSAVRGREADPEGGQRCKTCYQIRLEATASSAQSRSIPFFATTLSVSPHKSSRDINILGEQLAASHEVFFLAHDFKKKDGFRKSVEKSRQLGLYRQRYCGCCFSR